MKRTHSRGKSPRGALLAALKAVLIACILTAVLVLLLAISLKWEWISMERVNLVNTLIKAVSSAFCGWMISKLPLISNWLFAGIAGMTYMAVAFAVFGILNGSFALGFHTLSDLLMAFACASCVSIAAKLLQEGKAQKA